MYNAARRSLRNNMADIDRFFSFLGDTSKDHIMVSKDFILALISEVGKERLCQIFDTAWGNYDPDPNTLTAEDRWFRARVSLICRTLHVTHPNLGKIERRANEVCPKCQSEKIQSRGVSVTARGRFQRMQCCDCAGWFQLPTKR